jgi:23S rRNA pseudouridine1911/1915/1917 synthase
MINSVDKPVYPVKIRLDHWLAQQYPDISRSFLQKLCSSDEVLVNGKAEKSGFKLKPEDKVEVLYDMASIAKIDDINLPIIYQDKDVVVINKPSGVISHSRGKYWNEPSVASFIRQLTGQQGERPGIVHRLDRATSGVMICARNQAAMSWLQAQFAQRKVQKTYAALVDGAPVPLEAIIDMPIERNPKAPSSFKVGANGKPAQTTYKTLSVVGNVALVELKPHTGRTHQLRVHMKQLGHPILGDKLYGGPVANRLMLHAKSLELVTPDKQQVTFEAPLPPEFSIPSQNG